MVARSLSQLPKVFSQISDPRDARGVLHPFSSIVSLVFLGLLARITEMAVVERWAKTNWGELEEPLGFTRDKPPCDTTISRALSFCAFYCTNFGMPWQPKLSGFARMTLRCCLLAA